MTLANGFKRTGITVRVVRQRDGPKEQAKPCRIRLFRKTSKLTQVPVEIGLVWAVEKGGSPFVDERKGECQCCQGYYPDDSRPIQADLIIRKYSTVIEMVLRTYLPLPGRDQRQWEV